MFAAFAHFFRGVSLEVTAWSNSPVDQREGWLIRLQECERK